MMENNIKNIQIEISQKELEKMRPTDKKRSIQAMILGILQNNPNGITASQIGHLTNFDHRTILKHLEYLTAIREAYKIEMAQNFIIYYPNGKLMHPIGNMDYQIGDKYYRFSFIKNPLGEFLYIQERTKDEYNTFIVKGGLIVQKDFIPELADIMLRLHKEVNNDGGT